jgi:hypothetical protein
MSANTVAVEFTREEIAALLTLMDAGVKALGRPAARACAIIDERIAMAAQASDRRSASVAQLPDGDLADSA